MVSVLPCITDDSLPIKLSGPYFDKISERSARLLEPDIGLKRANGKTSEGKLILLNIL